METFDIYTEDRIKTGEIAVRGQNLEYGTYKMIIHVCVINSNNEMIIQKRHKEKKVWGDKWDISVAGGAIAGETSRQAATRETLEEIGLKANIENIRPRFTLNFEGGFDDFYIINSDVNLNELRLQEEEVSEVKLADKNEILSMIKNGEFIPYHPSIVEMIFNFNLTNDIYKK